MPKPRPLDLSDSGGGKKLKVAYETRVGYFGVQVGPGEERHSPLSPGNAAFLAPG